VDVLDGLINPERLVSGSEAQLRENKVSNEGLGVGLHDGPDVLVLDTLLEKVADQAKDTGAQPGLLGNPQLNLLQVGGQNVGSKVPDESVGKLLELGLGGQRSGVAVTIMYH